MASIEITTTQNVTIEYELANLRDRFLGVMLDSIIVALIIYVFAILLSFSGMALFQSRFLGILLSLSPIWMLILYYITCETLLNGQTLGKRAMGTQVVRLDGGRVRLSDLLLRSVLILADYVFSAGVFGALLISTTDRKQRLGDMAAGTTVIKLSKARRYLLSDILSISSRETYTPQYPQIRSLTEEDMLYIKTAILRYQRYPNTSHTEAIDELCRHLCNVLDIHISLYTTNQQLDFLKLLIKDYIVLTR